jgi:hypothetical protein
MTGANTVPMDTTNLSTTEANGSAAEDANQATTPEGGIADYIKQLHDAWATAVEAGNTTPVDALNKRLGEFVERERAIIRAKVNAALDIADSLEGQPPSPERDAQWLGLLQGDIHPGPYARYLITKLGDAALTDGVIRDRLTEIQTAWREKHADEIFHSKDLAILDGALERPTTGIGSLFQALSFVFRR